VSAYRPEDWTDLFVACAGASAALAGLVFVAVSINIQRILGYPGLPDRAMATLLLLLGVVVVSILGLVPGLGREDLGVLMLVDSVGFLAAIAVMMVRGAPMERPLVEQALRMLMVALGTVPMVVGAVTLLAGSGGGLYWTLAGIVGALLGGVLNAWVLLVEILR
jgi:modulator of FtsH protease